jgi:hypothetical protein
MGFVQFKLLGHIGNQAWLADGLSVPDGKWMVKGREGFVGFIHKAGTVQRGKELQELLIHIHKHTT